MEREREEELEVEYVRQKQEQPSYEALRFPGLHERLRCFVETGEVSGGNGYQHASNVIAGTALGKKYGFEWPSRAYLCRPSMCEPLRFSPALRWTTSWYVFPVGGYFSL